MGDTANSMMDDSVVDVSSSPTIIDVIDLTKESPSGSIRASRSRQRNTEDVSSQHGATDSPDRRCRRPLSPLLLGKRTRKERRGEKVPFATSSSEILTLDDTIKEDDNKDDKCYTINSDNREAIHLQCPICFESLTSNLKPITTRCGHVFCTECLESFIRISKKCATCKASITLKSCTRLYL